MKLTLAISRFAILALLLTLSLDAIWFGRVTSILRDGVRVVYSMRRLPGRPIGRLAIAVVTQYAGIDNDSSSFRALTETNFRQYCAIHGYDLVILDDHPGLTNRTDEGMMAYGQSGRRFAALKRALSAPAELDHRLYDWALWIDPDTLFLNMGRALEDIVDNRYDIIVSTGLPDDSERLVDARHLLIRNSPAGHEILDDLIRMGTEHCGQFLLQYPGAGHTLNGWLQVCNSDGSYWSGEAGMLLALYTFRSPDYRCRFKKIGHRIMNSNFPAYEDGDLALVFPDHMIDSRKKLIAEFLQHADFKRGRVDRSHNELLDPVEPGTGDWRTLEELFDIQVNMPCMEDGDLE